MYRYLYVNTTCRCAGVSAAVLSRGSPDVRLWEGRRRYTRIAPLARILIKYHWCTRLHINCNDLSMSSCSWLPEQLHWQGLSVSVLRVWLNLQIIIEQNLQKVQPPNVLEDWGGVLLEGTPETLEKYLFWEATGGTRTRELSHCIVKCFEWPLGHQ